MISNLESARALVQADLEHARSVLDLWSRQVFELEKALEQMDAVGQSRIALRDGQNGVKAIGSTSRASDKAAYQGAKRGRKPKSAIAADSAPATASKKANGQKRNTRAAESKSTRPNAATAAKGNKLQKSSVAKKRTGAAQPKFKDPNSDRTWTGHGRRPLWMTGDPQQYAVQPDTSTASAGTQDNASSASE